MIFTNSKKLKGFSLIESLVAVAIFSLVSVTVFQGYTEMTKAVRYARLKTTATALANEEFEIARNLSYEDVGIVDGVPSGKIPYTQSLIRDGVNFLVTTVVRNIDDSFDGTIGGDPNDLSPADYKLVELKIECTTCQDFVPLDFTTYVGPKNLESASSNGSLFVKVFDSSGEPVQSASVHVENPSEGIVINDTTNNEGILQIIDTIPGIESYEVSVSKTGFSSDQTYPTGAPGNPNPVKPHATVAIQTLTQISFAIDKISDLDVSSVLTNCSSTPAVDFSLSGSKLIGTSPDVFKYPESFFTTDSLGQESITGLEWDTYNLNLTDASYDLAGTIPLIPMVLNADVVQDFKIIIAPKQPNSVLVTVKDTSTQLPLSDATVTLGTDTLVTGRGFLGQTDWVGGSGQDTFLDPTRYFSSDGNLETNDPAGDVKLQKNFDDYESSGYLISSTFDTGSPSNFHQIIWQPQNQPAETGIDSVKFQVATNNDNFTWDFLGPDGTAGSFFTSANQNINVLNNDNQYFRYKMFLGTASSTFTPSVSDVSFTFTSSCVPPGQVLFTNLGTGDHDLSVSRSGYQLFEDTISVSSGWQQEIVTLTP